MRRRLFNLLAAISLVLCLAIGVLRLTTTSSQTGLTFSAPGKRFIVLKRTGAKGQIAVYRDWPQPEPLRLFGSEPYIGASGKAGDIDRWTDQRFGLFYERGHSYLYVAADDQTPLLGRAAMNGYNASTSPTPFWLLFFPLSSLIAITAVLPLIAALAELRYRLQSRRQRALAANRCAKCGYDLRATPQRCPECGLIPHKPAEDSN